MEVWYAPLPEARGLFGFKRQGDSVWNIRREQIMYVAREISDAWLGVFLWDFVNTQVLRNICQVGSVCKHIVFITSMFLVSRPLVTRTGVRVLQF